MPHFRFSPASPAGRFSIYHLPRRQAGLAFIIAIAALLRIALIPNPGFEADISFWKSWGLAVFDKGLVAGLKLTNYNYPTPFAYLLEFMVKIYSLFADPHNFAQFWENTNLLFLTISKAFPILADFGIAGVILYLGVKAKVLNFPNLPKSVYELLTLCYLFNPLSLSDGAWWGQVDSLGVLIFLVAIIMVLNKKPFWAGLIFMLSMMTKLQNMIYGPLFFLFLWQMLGYEGLIKALVGATLAFFGLNLEFFRDREMGRVIDSLTANFDYFPLMSLNAFNLWWIVTGAHGMQFSDKIAALGIINAKTVGLTIFASFYLFATLMMFFGQFRKSVGQIAADKSKVIFNFLTALIIVNGAFFLFQTESHDRYGFPLSVFLLLWATFWLNERPQIKSRLKIFLSFYIIFSLSYFYNLHTALVLNYPHNGIPLLSALTQPVFTITAAFVLLSLFGLFLVRVIKANPIPFLVPLVLANLALGLINRPLLTKTPVSLTRFTPIVSEQDYGRLAKNMTVQSSFGTSSWTLLSVQYAFFKQGFGTHANSRQVFDINHKFAKFSFDYGIDTEAGPQGIAVFEVWGDNKLLWRSASIGRYEMPRHAEVSISGVKYLTLITKPAGSGINDDHTDWLDPTLWP